MCRSRKSELALIRRSFSTGLSCHIQLLCPETCVANVVATDNFDISDRTYRRTTFDTEKRTYHAGMNTLMTTSKIYENAPLLPDLLVQPCEQNTTLYVGSSHAELLISNMMKHVHESISASDKPGQRLLYLSAVESNALRAAPSDALIVDVQVLPPTNAIMSSHEGVEQALTDIKILSREVFNKSFVWTSASTN